jgi:multidrug efflux pump subunit AcrA (membrane-fusion protein)
MTFNDNLASHYANVEQSNIMNSFIKYYIDSELVALKNLVLDAPPETLDTLNELAAAIGDDPAFFSNMSAANTTLQSNIDTLQAAAQAARDLIQADVDANETAAASALSTETSNRVAAVAALQALVDAAQTARTTMQADIDQNEADADAADAALSARLDTLEADPTTAAAVAAVQADVDQNETDSDAAEAALSARLDTLEADPTTAAAVAAVQADVDQNESDADAALALKAPLADPDFTGVLEVDTNARLEFDSNLTKVHNVLRGTSIVIGNNITLNPAAADGRVEVEGEFYLRPSDLTDAANDGAAAAAGVIVGQVYRNGSDLKVRVS